MCFNPTRMKIRMLAPLVLARIPEGPGRGAQPGTVSNLEGATRAKGNGAREESKRGEMAQALRDARWASMLGDRARRPCIPYCRYGIQEKARSLAR